MARQQNLTLTLTQDEALVLYDYLQRFSTSGSTTLEDQAEERALWNLCCLLEREMIEPFSENYAKSLESARERLRDPTEPAG
jgi:hypothetical protein